MDIARVIGSVVATRKYRTLTGMKLALIQPLDEELKAAGEPIVAVDLESRCGLVKLSSSSRGAMPPCWSWTRRPARRNLSPAMPRS